MTEGHVAWHCDSGNEGGFERTVKEKEKEAEEGCLWGGGTLRTR